MPPRPTGSGGGGGMGSGGGGAMGDMHSSVMHTIARQNPYAAAAMSRMSRQGRDAAQDVAQRAAAAARRTTGLWRFRTRESQLVRLMKEAGIILKTSPELVRRVGRRLGWTQHAMFIGPLVLNKRFGGRFFASIDYPGHVSVFDYVDGPDLPPNVRTFTRTEPPQGPTPFEFHGTLTNAWDSIYDARSGRHHRRFRARARPTGDEYRALTLPSPPRKRPPRR